MAVLSRITCKRCNMTTDASHRPSDAPPTICGACQQQAAASEREQHLAELAALSVEDRLQRIEEWIVDYRPQYVPPPRF